MSNSKLEEWKKRHSTKQAESEPSALEQWKQRHSPQGANTETEQSALEKWKQRHSTPSSEGGSVAAPVKSTNTSKLAEIDLEYAKNNPKLPYKESEGTAFDFRSNTAKVGIPSRMTDEQLERIISEPYLAQSEANKEIARNYRATGLEPRYTVEETEQMRAEAEAKDAETKANTDYLKELYAKRYQDKVKTMTDEELNAEIEANGATNPFEYAFSSTGEKFISDTKSMTPKAEKYERKIIGAYESLPNNLRSSIADIAPYYKPLTKQVVVSAMGNSVPAWQKKADTAYNSIKDELYALGYNDEDIHEFLVYSKSLFDAEVSDKLTENSKNAGTGELVAANIASVPANMASGIGQLDLTLQTLRNRYTGNYRPVNYNSPSTVLGQFSRKTRAETSERIENPVVDFIYNTGMSIVDSAASAAVGGQFLAPIILSGSAGLNAIYDAKERGLSDIQAVNLGLAASLNEALFEKISIDKFFEGLNNKEAKKFIVQIFNQAVPEGLEEVGTSLANQWADAIIAADKSQFSADVSKYMQDGKTEEEAKALAARDFFMSLGLDFLGGFFSGGVFGTVQAVANKVSSKGNTQTEAPKIEATVNEEQVSDTSTTPKKKTAPTTVKEAETATGFGKYGAELVADIANSTGATLDEVSNAVKTAYMAGRTDLDISKASLETETQIKAFTAGKQDALMQNIAAKEEAKNATVNGEFTKRDTPNVTGETLDNSAIVLEKNESSYPYDEREVIDGYENAVDDGVIGFINKIRSMKNPVAISKQKHTIGEVSERFKNDVRRLTNTEFDGDKYILRGNSVNHVDNRHGKNGVADHSMANDNDFARIGWVLDNYDTIEIAIDKKGNPEFDYQNQNSDQTPSPVIKIGKKINGTYFVVEAVPVSSAKAAFVKSAYISKNGISTPTAELLTVSDQDLQHLPDTENLSRANHRVPGQLADTINSISQSGEKINSKDSNATAENKSDVSKSTNENVPAKQSESNAVSKAKSTTKEKATAKETPKKTKTKAVETTAKIDDFGEKIGGARKDQWSSRGLVVDDLDGMNDRERDKNVKKDNVWKRPNYRALVEAGGDRGLLWAVNEIRKSLQQNVYYGYKATEETKVQKQKLFIETVRAIQSMAENAKTQADFEAMGEKWLLDNGYLEDTGKTWQRYAYTKKYSENPALSGSNYLNNIRYIAKNFNSLTALADRNQFAVDAKSVVPKGFSIIGGEGSVSSKLANGEWANDTSYAVAKGRNIIKSGFATKEEALEWLKQGIAKKKGKTRFVPEQLQAVHRKGPDYRNGKNVEGQDYIDTFGFKGGEFGNWMSAKDRQVSLDYGYDALKDLADALGIEDTDISFGGNLSIAFGARGQGLSGAAAHYENERRVINLTKMNGAGSLGHEWFHALDDFIGGYKSEYATNTQRNLPERTQKAIRNLITAMRYKDATQEETDLARQHAYERAIKNVTYQVKNQFGWIEKFENGALTESETKYFKRKPTQDDVDKYHRLLDALTETGDTKYIEELSDLRKEVKGHVIPKEDRDNISLRLALLRPSAKEGVQLSRKATDFYSNSVKFGQLHSKDGDYWDSTVEMAARAFACYVADKTNNQNDYLTAHSESAITLDTDKDGNPVIVRAYPVGEERTAINEAFDNLIEALKEDGYLHERVQTEKPAEVSYLLEESPKSKKVNNTDMFQDGGNDNKLAMWTTKRVSGEVKPKSISEIVASIEHEFGINITTGHIRGKGVLGTYTKENRGIKTKIANNLPVISHELGHYFERTLDIKSQLTDELISELESQIDAEFAENYTDEQIIREGVAEYVRRFLQNRETAAIDYPKFNDFFLKLLPSRDLAKLEQLADDINAYYSLDADTATSAIRFREEGGVDLRTPIEKLKDTGNSLYQAWIDSNYAIKRFDKATGSNAYMYASNAAYSDAIAGQIITGDLTDKNGQYISSGLKTALHGINLNNKDEYRLFGEYLTVKHGPERLREGMRVFADDRKNSTAFMERRQAELEEQYPQFEEASTRLYAFIKQFYKAWGVETGLISESTLKNWSERWEYYVPFNRVMEKGKGLFGAKIGFANQNSTIKKARGSGRDIKHPVDNIIDNIVKMVNAGTRNNVMSVITGYAEKLGADATLLEKVPMPLTATKMDMTGVKDNLTTWIEESELDADSKDKASGIVNNLDDILIQYSRGKAFGNVVTVMKNGEPQAWKINDVGLLESLTSLTPKTMDGILDAYAVVSRFMTSNITGNNLVWSIFSNLPRDFATFFTYSKNKNIVEMAKGVGGAYLNKFKGDSASPLYKEFLAMGGGKTSAYTSDRNLAKNARKKLSNKVDVNPISLIGFVSDLVESGPRFATYKMMREAGMSPQEAFYEAMDVTTNFRRSGRISKELNKVVPFFNASVQGLDKLRRWITLEELAGKPERKKAITKRTISYIAVSAALGAIAYAINNGDEEKEEEYEQLSTYTKNSYFVFPIGDGKYFAIPKPRDIGVLSSFFETCLEYGVGENDHAFDEFYAYASENFLPAIANDIAQVGSNGLVETGMGIIGSFGMIGVVGYLGANRDFLGRPIVSSGLQSLEPKDQYTDRTSKMAYWLGQAFNGSPEQIDYFLQQILGGWWKGQKALFPVGEKNLDWTLGVKNTYVKDNQYSTDLTNWLYDRADMTARAKNSNPTNIEKAITAKWDSNMTDFYGKYYKKAKNNSSSTAARATRQIVLDMIREYQKGIDGDYKTSLQKAVEAVCKSKNSTEYLPSVMPAEVTDGANKKHTLSDSQYVEYQTDYLRLYWETVEDTMTNNMSETKKAQILLAAKKVAREQATERTLKRIGAPSSEFATKYKGVDNDDLTRYFAAISEANADDSTKKKEVVDVIDGLGVDNDDAWTLYLSRYDSTGAQYAKRGGIEGNVYIDFIDALDRVDKPTEAGIYGTYTQEEATAAISMLKGLSREDKAILWHSVNPKWKNNPFR